MELTKGKCLRKCQVYEQGKTSPSIFQIHRPTICMSPSEVHVNILQYGLVTPKQNLQAGGLIKIKYDYTRWPWDRYAVLVRIPPLFE
jgi:hypothetical protein